MERATKEERLQAELELALFADTMQRKMFSRTAIVWRGLLVAADIAPGTYGQALADRLLNDIAIELRECGDIAKCRLPFELAGLDMFMAVQWPAKTDKEGA